MGIGPLTMADTRARLAVFLDRDGVLNAPIVRDGKPIVFEDAGDPILPSFVGLAEDGEQALALCAALQPDVLTLDLKAAQNAPLVISHAYIAPVPDTTHGWLVALGLYGFVSFYALGPGVCVWLALSELIGNVGDGVGGLPPPSRGAM